MAGKRVLFYVEHFRLSGEGAENDAVRLCRALAERGWEVHVAARDATEISGVVTHSDAFGRLAEVRAEVSPDVTVDWGFFDHADLHRLVGAPHAPYLPYARLSRGPLRAWWHDLFHGARDRRWIAKERELLTSPGETWLANSTFVKKLTIEAGAAAEAVKVLYIGMDLQRFSPEHCQQLRDEARSRLGILPDERVFLFVGHNLTLKNFSLAERTVRSLRADGVPARLILAGKRRPKRWPSWAIYVETTPRIEEIYAAADVLLHPTWFDCFSNVVIEAMACGLPVLASEFNGVIDIIDSGRNGVVLPVKGPKSEIERQWKEAAASLVANPAAAMEIGAAASRTVQDYRFDDYLDQFEAELLQVIKQRTVNAGH